MYIVPEATQYTHIKVELVLVALSADNLGAVSAKKSPLKYESETRELLGEKCYPEEGSCVWPPDIISTLPSLSYIFFL